MTHSDELRLADRLAVGAKNAQALAARLEGGPEPICGVVCNCGPNGEPIACGYVDGHNGAHSWATLPTPGSPESGRDRRCVAAMRVASLARALLAPHEESLRAVECVREFGDAEVRALWGAVQALEVHAPIGSEREIAAVIDCIVAASVASGTVAADEDLGPRERIDRMWHRIESDRAVRAERDDYKRLTAGSYARLDPALVSILRDRHADSGGALVYDGRETEYAQACALVAEVVLSQDDARERDASSNIERCPHCETSVAISPSGRFIIETTGGATHDADRCRESLVKARDDYKRVAESYGLLLAVAGLKADAP
jgi:hypothetical protein